MKKEALKITMVAATGENNNSFVGIKAVNNEVKFFYPETYQLASDDEERRKDILAILNTIQLSKTLTSGDSSFNKKYNQVENFPIDSYWWILNDYLTFGRYENREKVFERGVRGKINWKRTMRSSPIISNGNIIYSEIISERNNYKDNLLTEIYFYCVKSAVDSLGWIYGIVFDSKGINYDSLFNEKFYLNAIDNELIHSFDDKKKLRLQNMKNLIQGLDDNLTNTNEFIYGVDSYEYVFEKMIDKMFFNISNIKDFYPKATWKIKTETRPIESSKLRPDTIIFKDDILYIIDAKYYRYGFTLKTKDIPDTTSIQKQITYMEFAKNQKGYKDVRSAFILPYCIDKQKGKIHFQNIFEKFGTATAEWKDSKGIKNDTEVIGILIDTKFLINNWMKNDPSNIDELIKAINSP